MATSATITVTGKSGPGETVTAQVFSDVSSFTIDVAKGMLSMTLSNGFIQEIAISAATTMTVTISSGNYTIAIS